MYSKVHMLTRFAAESRFSMTFGISLWHETTYWLWLATRTRSVFKLVEKLNAGLNIILRPPLNFGDWNFSHQEHV